MYYGELIFRYKNKTKTTRKFIKKEIIVIIVIMILYMLKVVNNTTRYKKNVYSRY